MTANVGEMSPETAFISSKKMCFFRKEYVNIADASVIIIAK